MQGGKYLFAIQNWRYEMALNDEEKKLMEEYISIINILNDEVSKATVLFYKMLEHNQTDAVGIGTGFLLQFKNNFTFIVTAKHVIDDAKQEILYAKLSTEIIKVDLKYFVRSQTNDFAFILVNDLLVHPACTIRTSQIDEMETLTLFAVMVGFPYTKNRFEPRYNKTKSNFSSIYLYDMIEDHKSKTQIKNPIVCRLDDNNVFGNDNYKINMHKLNGMSGSPFFNIYSKNGQITITLVGIFVEWCKNNKEAIFVRASEVVELLESNNAFPCGCCGNMVYINSN